MTWRSMPMQPRLRLGQQAAEGGQQILFRARTDLNQCQTGGGMRHKDVHQSVARFVAESNHLVGDIDDCWLAASPQFQDFGFQVAFRFLGANASSQHLQFDRDHIAEFQSFRVADRVFDRHYVTAVLGP